MSPTDTFPDPSSSALAKRLFVSEIDGFCGGNTVSSSLSPTGLPPGSLLVTDAVLSICPASTSSCVTTYVAEQATASPGARVVGSAGVQSIAESPGRGSDSVTPESVTLPLFTMSKT